ncbi:fungal hydrophobin SC3-like protein [Schizophyllum commune]
MAVLARVYTMFFFVFAVLPCLAAAAAVVPRGGGGGGNDSGQHCSSGPVQCCQTSQSADSQGAAGLLGLLGVVLQDVTALIGLSCTDVNVLGGGGSECSAQTLCCENNHFDGLINLGCSPINIYL